MRLAALGGLAIIAAACSGGASMLGDASNDPPADVTADPWDAADADVDVRDGWDDDAPCFVAPPCPDGPEDGVMGMPCLTDLDCRDVRGSFCWTERYEVFDGEIYIYNPGGNCAFWNEMTASCDPDDGVECPDGSRCLVIGSDDYSGCIDECRPADRSMELHGWACGCRRGYECDINARLCFSGCSNDRQCCETWYDEDDDFQRDPEEVTLWPGCTSYCDGDDEEEWTDDCMASWACINPGREGALIGDPCEHDSHCPPDGTCLAYTDRETGEDYFPGGYCTKMGCQYAGRGCSDAGGACINMGSWRAPQGMCLKPCHVGREITDPDYECRTTPGEEQVCFPVHRLGWIGGIPEDEMDGYCFPGNTEEGTGGIGDDCTSDSDCASPFGLGECSNWFGDSPFCTIRCSEDLVLEDAICGPAAEGEIAPTLCGWSMCWPGCHAPSAALFENDCDREGFACAPLSYIGTTYVPEGALRPPGVCFPACDDDAFCEEMYETMERCNMVTGLCF
ncbi:MAG: hypothetical protein JRG91_04140 [Deltaproteobacteria bacterium]|nr:hypothetical protein [Deltaproteobacteria bacterium]